MRVTEDELVAHGIAHITDVKLTFLFAEHGIEEYLFEHVSTFLLYLLGIAFYQCLGQFVGLFDGVLSDALVVLLGVPRTVGTKSLHHSESTCECFAFLVDICDRFMLFHCFVFNFFLSA